MADPFRTASLELSVDPLVLVTGEGIVLEGNDAFGKLVGSHRQALNGRAMTELTGIPESELRALLIQCGRTSSVLPHALNIRDSHGDVTRYRARCAVVERGQTNKSTTFCLQLTPHHKATQAFHKLNQQIAALNREIFERVRAEARLREREAQLAVEAGALARLNELSSRLWHSLSLREGLEEMLGATIELLGADMGNVQLLDAGRRVLTIEVQRGFGPDFLTFFREVSTEENSACGRALRLGERVVIEDIETDVSYAPLRAIAHAAGYRAVQSTPLIARSGTPLGMISTHFRSVHRFTEQDLRRLDLYVRQAADFIERCRTEKALLDAKGYAESIISGSPFGLYVVDADFRIAQMNIDAQNGAFINVRPVIGRSFDETVRILWPQDVAAEVLTIFRHTLETGEPYYSKDFINPRRDKKQVEGYEWQLQRIAMPDGRHGVVCYYFDSTALRNAERSVRESEEKLRAAAEQLEQRVAERTKELAQSEDRLRMMATELNLAEQRERKRLATELHDHLQQILVLGKLLGGQGKRVGVSVPACLDVITKMDDIFTEALTYTRTLVADLSPLVLREHGLSAGLKWLGEYMKKYQISVTVAVREKGALQLPEDQAVLLFQSVRELLINSSKYAGTGHADVRLECNEGRLRIEVSDQGAGFDLAATSALGTPSGGISSKFGLFSIQERMRALGGSFELKSSRGKGTTALLVLPLLNRLENKVLNAQSSGTATTVRSKNFANDNNMPLRVLLADDHTMMRQGLRSIVAAYDHLEVVGEASDGAEAIELAQRLDPDVVVMDVNMSKMDGIEATRRIKANQPTIVIIGLSVNQSADTEQKMKAAGAAAYLTKEGAVDALCHAIEQAMSYKQHTAVRSVN